MNGKRNSRHAATHRPGHTSDAAGALGVATFAIETPVILGAALPTYLLIKQALTPELEELRRAATMVP